MEQGELDSYLIELTRDILIKKIQMVNRLLIKFGYCWSKELENGQALQLLNLGIPLTLNWRSRIFHAVSRPLRKNVVYRVENTFGPDPEFTGDRKAFINDIKNALYASKIIFMPKAIN